MFKFIENKRFFYLCAILSIIVTVLSVGLQSNSISTVFMTILTVIFLMMMIVFNSVEHKELMKVLTASFMQMVIIKNVAELSSIVEPVIGSAKDLSKLFSVSNLTFRGITLMTTTVLLLILFINHFVINFSSKSSKIAININKVVVTLYFVIVVVAKILSIVKIFNNYPLFNTMPDKLKMALILDGIPTMIYALTVVSMEAFVNAEREKLGR